MENQKIDFEFGWWVSMTPALIIAVYFVSRWNNNHADTTSLAIAVVAVSMGIIASSILCHPSFNLNSEQDQGSAAVPKSYPQLDFSPGSGGNDSSSGMFTAADIPIPRRYTDESDQPVSRTTRGIEQVLAGAAEAAAAPGIKLDDMPLIANTSPLSSTEVDAVIAAIHAACCEEALQRISPTSAEAVFAPITDGIKLTQPGDSADCVPHADVHENNKTPPQEIRALRDKLASAATHGARKQCKDQDALEAWFSKGMSLVQSGNFRDALYCFSFVLQQDPEHLPSLTTKAICLFQMKRYDEALRSFEQVQSLDADDKRAKEGIAATLKRMRAAES